MLSFARGKKFYGLVVLMGLYTGQRLGDVASLAWSQIDLVNGRVSFLTSKTGKRLEMALASPLLDHLSALPSSDDPKDFVGAIIKGVAAPLGRQALLLLLQALPLWRERLRACS